jgi:hypothetical protein
VVPATTPVTSPLVGFTVAVVVGLFVHVPPDMALPNVIVELTHTALAPVIRPGDCATTIAWVE